MLTHDIRTAFLGYFNQNQHTVVPSDGLIPSNDPTLLFTNAGMVPFKNVFTGHEKRPYTRATSSQKCVRAGGKHNDLDNVGYTARHHTFFEMLGNFSFGDYFKEEAIYYAWTFLTSELRLNPKKLYVTHYSEDLEARDLWKKISGFSDSKIISINTSDNFWSMGPTGPCGPCSEIFYDHGPSVQGGLPGTPDEDGDRYVEIWNLVFMQYDQLNDQERITLPKPCIDTGMGLERIAAVLQGTYDNFEIDIFKSLIELSSELTKTDPKGPHALSHRVIADHLRSASFMICDGILPSNEGRGYVLRRILRRALRYVNLTGYQGILMPKLVPNLVNLMGSAYPELTRAQTLIEKTLQDEEEKFSSTLSRGLSLLEEELTQLGDQKVLSGHVAFKLYDTYGFPLDMTQDSLKSKGIQINLDEFNQAMEAQKEKARANWKGSGDQKENALFIELASQHGETRFTGYESIESEGTVLALVKENTLVNTLAAGEDGYLIVDQTPFYAESGGQVGDTGAALASGLSLEVLDTQKTNKGLVFHKVHLTEGTLKEGDVLNLIVDETHRQAVRANHSATHLLHASLRKRFGEHVVQKGSLVTAEKLRFDFTFAHPLSSEDLLFLENDINATCRRNLPTHTKLLELEEAMEAGAIALFGEKYDEKVRVVHIGRHSTEEPSVELCGGTHVSATGEIGQFKIIHQSSVAAGIRRIEAITGAATERYLNEALTLLDTLAKKLKTNHSGVVQKVEALLDEKKALEKSAKSAPAEKKVSKTVKKIGEVNLIVVESEDENPKNLRPLMDALKKEHPEQSVFLLLNHESKTEKIAALLGVSTDLTHTLKANELIRDIAPTLEGQGGGGRPDMAQCGGKNKKNIPKCIKRVENLISNK